jgi:hypothetical protein
MDSTWVVVRGEESFYHDVDADSYVRYLSANVYLLDLLFEVCGCVSDDNPQVSEECNYWDAFYSSYIEAYQSGIDEWIDSVEFADSTME